MMTDIEMGTLEQLDFEFAPPCEVDQPTNCDDAAEWKMILSCCGTIYLFCDPHMEQQVYFMTVTPDIRHADCGGYDVKILSIERLDI